MTNRKCELPIKIIVHTALKGFIGICALVILFRYLSRRDLYKNVTRPFCIWCTMRILLLIEHYFSAVPKLFCQKYKKFFFKKKKKDTLETSKNVKTFLLLITQTRLSELNTAKHFKIKCISNILTVDLTTRYCS